VEKVVVAGGKVFVELGSDIGFSTRLTAAILPVDATVFAIDSWDTESREKLFLSNTIIKRLADKIQLIKMTTTQASKVFNKTIDFLFIDADHSYKSVYEDIMNWYQKLSKIGVICGDGYNMPGVGKAVRDAAVQFNDTVELVTNTVRFWKMNRN
jgi:predicted O-methyltransferase YrrM